MSYRKPRFSNPDRTALTAVIFDDYKKRHEILMSKRSRPMQIVKTQPKKQKLATVVKKEITKQTEKKWVDNYFSGNLTAGTTAANRDVSPATYLCLNSVGLGTTASLRIGKKINVISCQVNGTIRFLGKESTTGSNAPSPPAGKTVWVNLVLNKQNDQATTAVNTSEIYNNASGTLLGGGNMLRNPDFTNEYTILKAWRYDLPPRPCFKEVVANTVATIVADYYSWPEHIVHFSLFYKWKRPLRVRMSTSTGNIGDIIDNALHVTAGYGTEAETDSAPVITYNARVKFTDM